MLAHHRRLHNPLAIDHRAEAPGPSGVDQSGCDGATVKGCVVAVCENAIVGDNDAYRRVELAKTS